MTPIQPDHLELMIARAKSSGEIIWYQIKAIQGVISDTETLPAYDYFAAICDAFAKEFKDKDLGQLLAIEMFLRCAKRMAPEIKLHNRKEADRLKDKILRRK
jgi:hypothetical protein